MTKTKNKIDDINNLRRLTGLGVFTCSKAYDVSDGDFEKCLGYLKNKMGEKLINIDRNGAYVGKVFSYIHTGEKRGGSPTA